MTASHHATAVEQALKTTQTDYNTHSNKVTKATSTEPCVHNG